MIVIINIYLYIYILIKRDGNLTWKENCSTSSSQSATTIQSSSEFTTLLALGKEQQATAMELTHHIYTLSSIISQQMTNIDR